MWCSHPTEASSQLCCTPIGQGTMRTQPLGSWLLLLESRMGPRPSLPLMVSLGQLGCFRGLCD